MAVYRFGNPVSDAVLGLSVEGKQKETLMRGIACYGMPSPAVRLKWAVANAAAQSRQHLVVSPNLLIVPLLTNQSNHWHSSHDAAGRYIDKTYYFWRTKSWTSTTTRVLRRWPRCYQRRLCCPDGNMVTAFVRRRNSSVHGVQPQPPAPRLCCLPCHHEHVEMSSSLAPIRNLSTTATSTTCINNEPSQVLRILYQTLGSLEMSSSIAPIRNLSTTAASTTFSNNEPSQVLRILYQTLGSRADCTWPSSTSRKDSC